MTTTEHRLPHFPFSTRGDRLAPEMDELRDRCPVSRVTTNGGSQAWLVTGHAEARRVLREGRFARDQVADPDSPLQDAPIFAPELLNAIPHLKEAGLHEEVRRSLGPGLPDVDEERVEADCREGLTEMLREGAPADLHHHLSYRVAGRAMCRLLGLPEEDLPQLASWADTDLTMNLPNEVIHRNWAHLRDHVGAYMGTRPGAPAQGLVQRLAALNDRSGRLTREQLANILAVLFVAGYEDLASFLGVGAYHLLQRPEAMADLRGGPDRVEAHVEELLRYSVVMGNALARVTTEETDVSGVRIARGEMLLVSTDAANFDPDAFPEPHRYDPDRSPNPHLRFGHGRFYCPGAHMTRRISAIAFACLAELTDVRLAVEPRDVDWHPDRMAIMPVALPVRW
jgi:cytochrome P450